MNCVNCQNEIEPGAGFCGECGYPVGEKPPAAASGPTEVHDHSAQEAAGQLICANCNAKLSPDDVFCGECGFHVKSAGSSAEKTVDDQPTILEQPAPAKKEPPVKADASPTMMIRRSPETMMGAPPPRLPKATRTSTLPPPSAALPRADVPAAQKKGRSTLFWIVVISGVVILLCACAFLALGVIGALAEESGTGAFSLFDATSTTQPIATTVSPDSSSLSGGEVIVEVQTPPPVENVDGLITSGLEQIIRDSGVIYIGVNTNDVYPMIEYYDDEIDGFEVELAEEIVWRLFGDEVAMRWIPVSAPERFDLLQNGEIDMLIRNTAHTTSRDQLADWSINYFLTGPRLAVSSAYGYGGLAVLSGARVGIVGGTSLEPQLYTAETALGVDIIPVNYETGFDACTALLSGEIDALYNDWLALLSCTYDDPEFPVLGELLSLYSSTSGTLGGDPLAIGVPAGNPEFTANINAALFEIMDDGTWQDIYDSWFYEPAPWTMEQMLNEPAPNR